MNQSILNVNTDPRDEAINRIDKGRSRDTAIDETIESLGLNDDKAAELVRDLNVFYGTPPKSTPLSTI